MIAIAAKAHQPAWDMLSNGHQGMTEEDSMGLLRCLCAGVQVVDKQREAKDGAFHAQCQQEWRKEIQNLVEACRYLKTSPRRHASHLVTDQNEVVTAVAKMHDMLLKAGLPLFQLYQQQDQPGWNDFKQEYLTELESMCAECPGNLPEDAL